MFFRISLSLLSAVWMVLISGCGVATDMARDMDLRWKFIGHNPTFVSPVKLKIAILPFEDQAGLGAPQAGANLARLLAETLSEDSRLIVVSPQEVAAYMAQRGLGASYATDNEEVAQIARELGANAVVTGSVSQVAAYNQRKNWRRYFRFMTSSQEYVTAMINIRAVDAATGIVLTARTNVGDYRTGPADTTSAEGSSQQENIENSLDMAIEEAAYRTIEGLANLPFKATVQTVVNDEATISFGREVGLKKGRQMQILATGETITNVIGQTYQVYGPAIAELEVIEAGSNQARLRIIKGSAATGDMLQLSK